MPWARAQFKFSRRATVTASRSRRARGQFRFEGRLGPRVPTNACCSALPVLVAACASSQGDTRADAAIADIRNEGREAVRIVDARYGREHSVRAEEMTLPFGPNQNGNELIVAALEQARERGAAYLGDLAITMTFRWGGTPIECRTQVRFERDPTDASPGAAPAPILPASAGPQYGTDVEKYRPAKVAFVAEDRRWRAWSQGDERAAGRLTRTAERRLRGKVGFVPPNGRTSPNVSRRGGSCRRSPRVTASTRAS